MVGYDIRYVEQKISDSKLVALVVDDIDGETFKGRVHLDLSISGRREDNIHYSWKAKVGPDGITVTDLAGYDLTGTTYINRGINQIVGSYLSEHYLCGPEAK